MYAKLKFTLVENHTRRIDIWSQEILLIIVENLDGQRRNLTTAKLWLVNRMGSLSISHLLRGSAPKRRKCTLLVEKETLKISNEFRFITVHQLIWFCNRMNDTDDINLRSVFCANFLRARSYIKVKISFRSFPQTVCTADVQAKMHFVWLACTNAGHGILDLDILIVIVSKSHKISGTVGIANVSFL